MSKFIEILETSEKGVYCVQTKRKKELLGYIKYNSDWKRNTFRPDNDTEFDWSCMADISDFSLELDTSGVK